MKQLLIFDDSVNVPSAVVHEATPPVQIHQWHLYVDGASKNNPGPSGGGFCIFKDGKVYQQEGYFFGIRTNNQAEYLALLLGLFFLEPLVNTGDQVVIFADSQLLVRQVNGLYKVKNLFLQSLHRLACQGVKQLRASFVHVLRNDNKDADKMANKGVASKKLLPNKFIEKLDHYGIVL